MARKYGWHTVTNDNAKRRAVFGDGAFGEVLVAPLTPLCQRDFTYGGHADELYEYELLTGTVAYEDSMAVLSTGASQFGTAFLRTERHVRYRPGQGAIFRFTALFGESTAGVSQVAGAFGGSENGLFVGYDYTDTGGPNGVPRFGVCRQYGGARDVHTLQITTPAGGAETLVVTLNGTATNVSLTSGTAEQNAQEVADTAFSGWVAEASGDTVRFLADNVGAREGVYSAASAGAAVAAFTQRRPGGAVTEEWVYQENLNGDTLDGNGPTGMTLDPTKGNVYEIRMQYLGFGAIDFLIEDVDTGKFELIHRFKYTNNNTRPSSDNPIYAVGAAVSSIGGANDISLKLGSLAGFVEGAFRVLGPDHGASSDGNIGGTTTAPILSVRCNEVFVDGVSKINLRELLPTFLAVSGSGSNRPIKIELVLNGTLTAPRWVDYDTTHSYGSTDSSATAISGGDVLVALSFPGAGGNVLANLADKQVAIRPGNTLSIVMTTTGNAADYVASISWKEDS